MATIANMGLVFEMVEDAVRRRGLKGMTATWLRRRLWRAAGGADDCLVRRDGQTVAIMDHQQWDWIETSPEDVRKTMSAVKETCSRRVAKALGLGEPVFGFTCSRRFLTEIEEVADWLAALPEMDPQLSGKLERVSWTQAVDFSRRWHERMAEAEANDLRVSDLAEGTTKALELADGWSWVRLETAEALDCEGGSMGHCVGQGGYDRLVSSTPPDGVYSLRGPEGMPHATVEIQGGRILQVQGKANTVPRGHAERMAALVLALGVGIGDQPPGRLGLAVVGGRTMPVGDALALMAAGPIDGDVDLRESDIRELPPGTDIRGDLDLRGCLTLASLPDGLHVEGRLSLRDCISLRTLPDEMDVGKWLNLRGCVSLQSLPEPLTVGGDMHLHGCTAMERLPEGLVMAEGRPSFELPKWRKEGWLGGLLSRAPRPKGLNVESWLDISGCASLTSLPEDMTLGGKAYGDHPGLVDLWSDYAARRDGGWRP